MGRPPNGVERGGRSGFRFDLINSGESGRPPPVPIHCLGPGCWPLVIAHGARPGFQQWRCPHLGEHWAHQFPAR